MRLKIAHLCLLATLLCCLQHVYADTLIIESVACIRVATGIDNWVVTATNALLALFKIYQQTQGDAPLTINAVADAANAGMSNANTALSYLDQFTSGEDDLIIKINGEHVFPPGGNGHGSIHAGEAIEPNIRFDFDGDARIQFIEYDTVSDSDDLGSIDVVASYKAGQDYTFPDALLFSTTEGDAYNITYRVERNDRGKDPKWLLCGTVQCKLCVNDPCCVNTPKDPLDRDEDGENLKECPPGFSDIGFREEQYNGWGRKTLYLRKCANQYTTSCPNARFDEERWLRSMIRNLRENQALRRQLRN